MTSTQYLEFSVEMNDAYLQMHNHEGDCIDCKVARAMRDVARSMLRDNDYCNDLGKTIRNHSENVVYTLEQSTKV